jgi:hypothetical protein
VLGLVLLLVLGLRRLASNFRLETTKYEDEGVLVNDNFCRLHIILHILSWTSLVVAQRVFPCVAVYEC